MLLFCMAQELRDKPEADALTGMPGTRASQPDFILNVPIAEIDGFVQRLQMVKGGMQFRQSIVDSRGVGR